MNEYILCAAIHFDDGEIYPHRPKNISSGYVVCGRRHHNCFEINSLIHKRKWFHKREIVPHIQGFLTNTDRFVDRKEAYKIAFEAKQIKDKEFSNSPYLISEDLY